MCNDKFKMKYLYIYIYRFVILCVQNKHLFIYYGTYIRYMYSFSDIKFNFKEKYYRQVEFNLIAFIKLKYVPVKLTCEFKLSA